MKKILLTGVNGQVGHALFPKLTGYEVRGLPRESLDLTNPDAIRAHVNEFKPDIIINPAAYTAVDKAESEPDLAYAVNVQAPQVLAEEAAKLGAAMIHFSTDYVYDGTKPSAYVETDLTNPQGVYAETKLAGEDAVRAAGLPHLILRTSWVYGAYGKNFMKTILRLAGERDSLRVVADQVGAPTSSGSIAEAVVTLLKCWQTDDETQSGIYHLTNAGRTSWHGFASEILNEYQSLQEAHQWPALKAYAGQVLPISTAEYPTPAKRPANSVLDNAKLNRVFDVALPDWRVALHHVIQDLALQP
jgi:dTDP-4-dehydrorhamnose reductase